MLHQVVNIFHLVGVVVLQKSSKILICISLEEDPGPCSKAALLFFDYSSLSLHPLPSSISNCLNLPFGTQGRSWRLNEAYFLQTRNGGHRKGFGPRSPTGPAWFHMGAKVGADILFYFIYLFFLINLFIYLFIFDCVGSSFLCKGFLQLWQAGATLHRGARASHCRGLSRCGAQAPDAQAQ